MVARLKILLKEVRSCRECEAQLPLGPRPVLSVARGASLVVVGQAPGTRVHESGVPWDDASGDHLRAWMGLNKDQFYTDPRIAILPMGFCYPGRKGAGDAPPRPECAPLWHGRLLEFAKPDAVILLAGMYAHRYYLGSKRKPTLGATVRSFEEYLPRYFALPHPSWRSKIWMKKNPWFEQQVLPTLADTVRSALPG